MVGSFHSNQVQGGIEGLRLCVFRGLKCVGKCASITIWHFHILVGAFGGEGGDGEVGDFDDAG